MSRRMTFSTAGALVALLTAPLSTLHSQTPQTPQDTSRFPPWARRSPPVSQTPAPAPTPTSPSAPDAAVGSRWEIHSDSARIQEAVYGNVAEIRLGNTARDRASDASVKDFAGRMVKDHRAEYDGWVALASQNGLTIDANADTVGKATVDQLSALSGADFDRAYMAEMVRDHQADISRTRQTASSADAAGVRALAAKAVPVMQQHLSEARQLANRVGATAVASGPNAGNGGVTLPVRDRVADRNLNADDRQYVNEVAVGHLMEVRLAEMAQNKARDGEVKKFAGRLHDDFSRWLSRWEALGAKDPHMGRLHQQKVERLDKANRKQFDRTYLDIVRENLASMIPYFEKEGRASKVARVRNLVNDELPTLRQNLQTAERLNRQAQASR